MNFVSYAKFGKIATPENTSLVQSCVRIGLYGHSRKGQGIQVYMEKRLQRVFQLTGAAPSGQPNDSNNFGHACRKNLRKFKICSRLFTFEGFRKNEHFSFLTTLSGLLSLERGLHSISANNCFNSLMAPTCRNSRVLTLQ